MKKIINEARVEGRLFSAELETAEVTNKASTVFGQKYIKGKINIAIDEDGVKTVPIHYSFVSATTKTGKPNSTYKLLEQIIADPNVTWEKGGKENAMIVVASPALNLNEFYAPDQNTNELSLASSPRLENGFLSKGKEANLNPNIDDRCQIKVDMLITGAQTIEADEEKNIKEHVLVKGCIFNFRNELLPMSFKITAKEGIEYFSSLEVSNAEPIFACVYATLENTTIETTKTIEVAFGKPKTQTAKYSRTEWILTTIVTPFYEFGEENILTVEKVKEAVQARETKLAELKAQREKYEAEKKNGAAPTGFPTSNTATTATAKTKPGFNF